MKKLLNKKGSVLFLVVVVMSILLVVASATYYIVSNQRQSVEVHYNSEQSYQTAYSVSKTVEGYFAKVLSDVSQKKVDYENTIFGKIVNLADGGTLTSQQTDLEKLGLGKFDITITKTKSNGDETFFEVTTKSVVNGEVTSLTQVWKVKLSAADTKYFTRFLTSTGLGVPTDTYLKVQQIYGENYFENEFTTITNPTIQHRSIYSTGTLIDNGISYEQMEDKDVVVAGSYYLDDQTRDVKLRNMLIGGDMQVNRSSQNLNVRAIYILGDCYFNGSDLSANNTVFFIQGDCYINCKVSGNCKIYVGNNLYYDKNWKSDGELYVNKDVYFKNDNQGDGLGKLRYGGKMYNASNNEITENDIKSNGSKDAKTFADSGETFDVGAAMKAVPESTFDGWTSVATYISNNTAVGTYQDWNALKFFEKGKDGEADGKFYNAPSFNVGTEISAAEGSGYKLMTGSKNNSAVKKSASNSRWLVTINESCKYVSPDSAPGDGFTILIDASKEDIYIYLDDNGKGTFRFRPDDNKPMNVLVVGSYSVIFVLPENITFEACKDQFIGHYEIAKKIANNTSNNYDWLIEQDIYLVDGKSGDCKDLFMDTESGRYSLKTIKDDEDEEYTVLDDTKFNHQKVHNNIFLVSRGHNQFDFTRLCTLAGYVYAPNTTLEITAQGNHMKFFGGLIVGGFKYDHQDGLLAFCEPYDAYNGQGSKVVSNLISQANGGSISDSDTPSKGKKQLALEFNGYK